jgi:hypothetical protein
MEITFVDIVYDVPPNQTLQFRIQVWIDGVIQLDELVDVAEDCEISSSLCTMAVAVRQFDIGFSGTVRSGNWGVDSFIGPDITLASESWLGGSPPPPAFGAGFEMEFLFGEF